MSLSQKVYKFWISTSFFGTLSIKKSFWKNFEKEFNLKSIHASSGSEDITLINYGDRICIYQGDSQTRRIELAEHSIVNQEHKLEQIEISKEFYNYNFDWKNSIKVALKGSKYQFRVKGVIFFFQSTKLAVLEYGSFKGEENLILTDLSNIRYETMNR